MLAAADSTAGATGTTGDEVFTGEAPCSAFVSVLGLTSEQKTTVHTALSELATSDIALSGETSSLAIQKKDGTVTFDRVAFDQIGAFVLEVVPPSGMKVETVRTRVEQKVEATGTPARFDGLAYPPEATTEPGAPPKKDIPPEREFDPQKVKGDPQMGWFGWSMVIGGSAIALGLIGYAAWKGSQ